MTDTLDPLILDLLEWLVAPRAYSEVMEAWRTSCPRLTVWEDTLDRGFVVRRQGEGAIAMVEVTPLGVRFLQQGGRTPAVSTR